MVLKSCPQCGRLIPEEAKDQAREQWYKMHEHDVREKREGRKDDSPPIGSMQRKPRVTVGPHGEKIKTYVRCGRLE